VLGLGFRMSMAILCPLTLSHFTVSGHLIDMTEVYKIIHNIYDATA